MELETIVLDKEQAREKWREYIEAEKTEKRTGVRNYLRDMRRAYYYLKKGQKVLDFFETVKKVGLNADSDPKLAITPVESSWCQFKKARPGRGTYSRPTNSWRDRSALGVQSIQLPENTFPAWPTQTQQEWDIARAEIRSPAPVIPAKYQNKGEHLYLMWEVEKWEPMPAKDPLLLRRITKNLFVIYGHWNTTKLERAIVRGRL